jgi:elongation factor P hydroxylase
MVNEVKKLSILVKHFNLLFECTENTRLQHGAQEPFYKAPRGQQPAIIFSRETFYSSALHEIAHWSIAGQARREQDDFGYWYQPEGRSASQQLGFEQVEIKPQAIEWALSLASDHQFHFSADNLSQACEPSAAFRSAVYNQLVEYLHNQSLPASAHKLFARLNQLFRQSQPVEIPHV